MNEKDKKPSHYTTGENGEVVPVYLENPEAQEEAESEKDSTPLYYVTEPTGEVKPVGVNTETETEGGVTRESLEQSPSVEEKSEPAESILESSESQEITLEEIPAQNDVINVNELLAEEETEKEELELSTKQASKVIPASTENIAEKASYSTEKEETTATEADTVVTEEEPANNIEDSNTETADKPTEEDLQKVDLKLDQEKQEVESASKLISEPAKEKGNKKKKGIAAAVAGALALVGIGVGVAANSSPEGTKSGTSTSAEANPGSQEQINSVLSGITVENTLKEFDTKEQKNVITLQDAKDFSSNTTNTPVTEYAYQLDPGSPVADYNVKIFNIMLNGSPDEIRDLLKNLGLGPQELKDRYDRAVKLGTYNEWGDMSEQAYSHAGWPMGQGALNGSLDTLNPGIMYNKVWAIAIANAVEVTGGDIAPAQPRDAATLAKNRELIESQYGKEGNWTLYFATDDSLKESSQPGEVLTGPPNTQFTNPDDLMVIYIDPNNKDTLILSDSIPTEKLTNIAYTNIYPMPANIGEIIPYGYAGPTSISKFVQHSTT